MKRFLECARRIFQGRATLGDLGTASDHYKRLAKAGAPGFSLEEAAKPPEDEINPDFEHLLTWYGDIRDQALRGQYFEPIELQAILAYEHFLAKVGIEMTAFDWEMLTRLDRVWRECVPKPSTESRGQNRHQKRPD